MGAAQPGAPAEAGAGRGCGGSCCGPERPPLTGISRAGGSRSGREEQGTQQEQIGARKGAGARRAESRAGPAERGGRRGEVNAHPLPSPAVTVARSPGTASHSLPPAARAHPPLPFLAAAGPGRQLRQPHARREQEQDGAR